MSEDSLKQWRQLYRVCARVGSPFHISYCIVHGISHERLIAKSALLQSEHQVHCDRRLGIAAASYHPARHPRRQLLEKFLPTCNCVHHQND